MSWNRNDPTNAKEEKGRCGTSPAAKGITGGVIAIAAIGVLIFLFSGGERQENDRADSARKRITATTPAKSAHRPLTTQEKAKKLLEKDDRVRSVVTTNVPSPFPYKDGRKVISSRTNSWMQVVDICIMPNGVRRKVIRDLRKPLFTCKTDTIIAQALAGGVDEPGPPLPIDADMEDDFIESLKTPIEFNANDSDEIKERKMLVKEAREQILAGIAEGGTFFGILSEHVSIQKHNAELKDVVMKTVEDLRAGGDEKLLNDYLSEANKLLGENGVSPVSANNEEGEEQNEENGN